MGLVDWIVIPVFISAIFGIAWLITLKMTK